ncbi:MAG: hypothetical protein JWQ27_780 [Ferruginibacter sp.]|nr:hypothetical protein [Ferruginibacter sp.]
MEQQQNLISNDLQVDHIAYVHLKESASWAKFLGIVGFVISVLIGIVGLFAGSLVSRFNRGFGDSSAGMMGAGFITVIYLVIAIVYFLVSLYVFRFGTKMKQALQATDQENFNDALSNLKGAYRIVGIITIIYTGLIAIAMVFAIGTALLRK